MKRPTGLTAVGVVAIVLGLAQIASSIVFFNFAGLESLRVSWLYGDILSLATTLSYAIGVGLIVLGVMGIVFAVAALGLRKWAWTLGIVTYLLGIAGAIFMLFMTATAVAAGVTGVVSAIMAWYLSTEDVRQAFGQTAGAAGGQTPHAV